MMSLLQIPATLKQPMSCDLAYLLTNLKFPQQKCSACECLFFNLNLTNMDHSLSYHQQFKGFLSLVIFEYSNLNKFSHTGNIFFMNFLCFSSLFGLLLNRTGFSPAKPRLTRLYCTEWCGAQEAQYEPQKMCQQIQIERHN